ncbi:MULTISPECIES: hypothetical protein [Colwellia]|nr:MULTISPECIES: hypothetical protein [Colwellia]
MYLNKNKAAKDMIRYFTSPTSYVLQAILIIGLSGCHNDKKKPAPSIINNIAPLASDVTIITPTQPNKDITASYTYFDEHDLEGSSLYSWLIDDIVIANSLSFTLPNDSEGKYLTFCITPIATTGEITQGLEVCETQVITGQYTKPTIDALVLTSSITTGIEVSATYLFVDENERLEGDSVFNWKINDSDYSAQKIITFGVEHQGSFLILCLTPIAISGENATGDTICSDEILIAAKEGDAPSIENLQLANFAKATNEVSVSYDYVDSDGDLEFDSTTVWSIDGAEVSQMPDYILPYDSAGKLLSVCVTPIAISGSPAEGATSCVAEYIADIVITGKLELYQTISLAITGYSFNSVTWRILHPSYSSIRSTDSSSFIITGTSPTEEANWLIGHDLEVCIDTIESGEICLFASEQPITEITGGLPTELDTDNNISKRVIAPVSFIDLTISGTSKRLHRPLNVVESILANANSAGSVPLHDGQYLDINTGLVWAIYEQQTAIDSCSNRSMILPVQGESDTSDAFGLHQFYSQIASNYSQFIGAYIVRAMGWPGVYYRSSSFHSVGYHYDYYLIGGFGDYIKDETTEAAACLTTLP